MDLGYGTLARLPTLVDSSVGAGIDVVIITHKHPDYMLDLHGLFGLAGDEGAILDVFDWHRLPDERPYDVGPFELRRGRCRTSCPTLVSGSPVTL
jgi:glyoxylase-like metal-dependent hydrolase (beta-lactamase superfamily II)